MHSDVWAITSYFNPTGSRRRRVNFEIFRQRLNVPFVVVELATDQPFELGPHDAPIVVQIRSSSVLWHKERLLNIAVQHVPRRVLHIAWIDGDVIFGNDSWAEEASKALSKSALVQPFDYVFNLPAHSAGDFTVDIAGAEPIGPTFVSRFGNKQISQEVLRSREPSRVRLLLGLAWMARRSLIESHGFYDALIVGSGDRAMTLAAYGFYAEAIEALRMNVPSTEHYLQWAKPFHAAVTSGNGWLAGPCGGAMPPAVQHVFQILLKSAELKRQPRRQAFATNIATGLQNNPHDTLRDLRPPALRPQERQSGPVRWPSVCG